MLCKTSGKYKQASEARQERQPVRKNFPASKPVTHSMCAQKHPCRLHFHYT
jgi:hypothetical protein